MKMMKWMSALGLLWALMVPAYAVEAETLIEENFDGLNPAKAIVKEQSDSAYEQFVICLAYLAQEDEGVLLKRIVNADEVSSSYCKETLDLVVGKLKQDLAYRAREAGGRYQGIKGAITLLDQADKKAQAQSRIKKFGWFTMKQAIIYGPGSALCAPRDLAELSVRILGGKDRTDALLKGIVFNDLTDVLEMKTIELLNAAIACPTKRNVKEAEMAFYAYKNALIAASENAMDLKLSESEMESLVAALAELSDMEFDNQIFGIIGVAY